MSIVKMKKATILTLNKEKRETTNKLRDLGLLHIQIKDRSSEEIDTITVKTDRAKNALILLNADINKKNEQKIRDFNASDFEKNLNELVNNINDLNFNIQKSKDDLERIQKEILKVEDLGQFEPQDIEIIKNTNINFAIYKLNKTQFNNLLEDIEYIKIKETKNNIYISVTGNKLIEDLEIFEIPELSEKELYRKLDKVKVDVVKNEDIINSYINEIKNIENYISLLEQKLEFARVELSIDSETLQSIEDSKELSLSISTISGFIPSIEVNQLEKFAKDNNLGLILDDPNPEDRVPTKIKNSEFVNLINPVMDFLQISPGYNESDISLWFLTFFSIFFGMIVGDGAYGTIMLLLAIFLNIKFKPSYASALLTLLSCSTIIWGAMTGNWFAIPKEIIESTFLGNFIIYDISVFNPDSQTFIQFICFVLGTIHLSIARIIAIIKKVKEKNILQMIGQIGSLMMILGMIHVVLFLVIDKEKYSYAVNLQGFPVFLILFGLLFIFLFSNQDGTGFFNGVLNSFKNIISIVLGIANVLADIISYIRLFAVGLAGYAISSSFNSMASGLMDSGGVAVIGAVLILVVAHTLNILMALLSVLVHGIRLNVLEFSMHIGNEWTGIKYNPFKKNIA